MIGTAVFHYRIIKKLGGRKGVVCKAEDTSTLRAVEASIQEKTREVAR